MNPSTESETELSREELMSLLFAELVIQQSNMATIFLGRVANPQTGKTTKDLDAARLFIDQLEMLEAKTKGNLSKEEETLLKQSLTQLRMAFVEASNEPDEPKEAKAESGRQPAAGPTEGGAEAPEAESRKKFTKKY